jgi:hypothetical protein
MDSVVYDSEMLKQIEDLLKTAERYDLIQYLKYLEELILDDDVSDSEEEEEKFDVGKTIDGFYYLK